jgi:hypothetical protein
MFDADHAQQAPKPPAPEPGVPPDDVPPLPPPDIPVPDPAPPPIENPGDAPLQPITDPDVVEPGEPHPAHTPMRVRGAKRSPEDPAASSSALKACVDTRNERVRSLKSASTQGISPQHERQDLSGSKGVTEREVVDIEERAQPRTRWKLEISRHMMENDWSEMFFKGISAGFLIAAMVWLVPSTDTAKFHAVTLMI